LTRAGGHATIVRMKRLLLCGLLLASLVSLTACRTAMYSAYEKVGVYKRDLLKKRVVAARDEEKNAQQEFKDALTRLKEITGIEGGELEKRYRQLQSDYDDAAARVATVHKRVQDVETVAGDLFAEWDKENRQIETDALRQTSRQQLNDTRQRYEEMVRALKRSESGMDPVLRKLHDYVLALKHTLNAQAIAALGGESAKIQADVSRLIEDMNTSIARADEFIRQMPK
jgi:predicted  nucleic acid-binding Zn-ribbon protein